MTGPGGPGRPGLLVTFVRMMLSRNPLFKVRYSGLALLNVGLGFLNSLLALRVFGVGIEADALFISGSIVVAISLVSSLLVEQFLYFYCEERARSTESAHQLWSTAITIVSIAQVALCGVLYLAIDPVIATFSMAIDPGRRALVRVILPVQLFGLAVFPVNTINRALFNAERRFALPFIMQLLPPLGSLVALLVCLVRREPDVVLFAACNSVGLLCLAAIQAFLLHGMGFRFSPRFRHPTLVRYLFNSMTMRMGHNINNLLLQPIITNAVAGMSVGNASSYGYGRKLVDVIQTVLLGPSFNILNTRIADAWVRRDVAEIRAAVRSYIVLAVLLLPPFIVVAAGVLPPLLGLIAGAGNLSDRIPLIRNLFLLLCAWLLMASIETPFVLIISAAKKSLVFIVVNTVNICIIASAIALLSRRIGIYSIPTALMIGQVANMAAFILVARRMLQRVGVSTAKSGNPAERGVAV